MVIQTNKDGLLLRRLQLSDCGKLACYWQQLSDATRSRYAPHPFDIHILQRLYANGQGYRGYIAIDNHSQNIVAYAGVKIGGWEPDAPRLQGYDLTLNPAADASFAPSVADAWQGQGIGKQLLQYIKTDLMDTEITRLILWGGVQSTNQQAARYYRRQGFVTVGRFEYHGQNEDMVLDI